MCRIFKLSHLLFAFNLIYVETRFAIHNLRKINLELCKH